MSFERERDGFKEQDDSKLPEKYNTLTLNSDACSDSQKTSDQHENNSNEKGESQSKWKPRAPSKSEESIFGVSNYSKSRSSSTSNQTLGWRDAGFQYERNAPPKRSLQNKEAYPRNERDRRLNYSTSRGQNSFNWRNETEIYRGLDKNFKRENSANFSNEINSNEEKIGWWGLNCYYGDKYTDTDYIWDCIQQIYSESPDLFARPPTMSPNFINFYTRDFEDVQHLYTISCAIRQKLKYPSVFHYFIKTKNSVSRIYMSTCDGDIYKQNGFKGWKLVEI